MPQTAGGARASPTRSASAIARSLKKGRSHQQKLSLTRKCLKTHSETSLASDHPVRAFSERDHFFDGAPTPPLQGREHARLNSFTKGKTSQVSRPADRKDDPPHGDLDPVDRKDDPPHGDLDPADHDLESQHVDFVWSRVNFDWSHLDRLIGS